MEILAEIRYNQSTGKVMCALVLNANHVPLYDPNVDIEKQFSALVKARQAIESAIGRLNQEMTEDTASV